jgi:hypothetical protein
MNLRSEILDKEFEVDTYNAGSGKLGIKDVCLSGILFNQMPEELEVNFDIMPITAAADYCAVRCTITDNTGRKIQAFNDVSLAHLEKADSKDGKNGKEDEFVKQHPLTQAVQSAVASAVKLYLGWPRLLNDEQNGTTVVSSDTPEAATEEAESVSNDNIVVETETGPSEKTEAPVAEAETEVESKALGDYTTEELGAMLVTSGVHKGKPLFQVWDEKPSWFDYISKNTSEKYKFANEYAKRQNK